MAVLLCREGERKSQAALPPEERSLPRVTVRNQPVSAALHWSGRLRARTPEHIAYAQPEREQVWREKFERLGILGIGMQAIRRRTLFATWVLLEVLVARQQIVGGAQLAILCA